MIPQEASFSMLSFDFLSMFELVRIGLWATFMLKPPKTLTFAILGESFALG